MGLLYLYLLYIYIYIITESAQTGGSLKSLMINHVNGNCDDENRRIFDISGSNQNQNWWSSGSL